MLSGILSTATAPWLCFLQITQAYNRPTGCKDDRIAPLRFTVVVSAEPDDAALTPEQQQGVRELLDNDDGRHKTVIAATLAQTQKLLAAIKAELMTAGS